MDELAALRAFRQLDLNLTIQRPFRDYDNPLDYLGDLEFRERHRVTRAMFFDILGRISHSLDRTSQRGNPIPSSLELLITLRILASGSFQMTVGDLHSIHQSTTSRVFWRVIEAMIPLVRNYITWPNHGEAQATALENYNAYGFPCVEGVIDGTHVEIEAPHQFEESYVNRHSNHSINVQIVSNGQDLRIIDLVACWPGSTHDAHIFRTCALTRRFESGELPQIPGGVLLGDSGYPLLKHLMTPIPETPTTTAGQLRYNKAHKMARCTVERTIGVLKRRWAILNYMRFEPTKYSSKGVVNYR